MANIAKTRSEVGARSAEDVAPSDARGTGRARNFALWVLQTLTAAAFLMAGFAKLTGDPRAVWVFTSIGVGDWLVYSVGFLEILGAIALLVPRLAGLSGLAFVVLTVGAVITHVVIGIPIAFPAVLLVFAAVIAWGRREATVALFART